jgi:large subunit ribosomal protein L23
MADATKKLVAAAGPSFKLGLKKIFLPTHIVTLLRKPKQPPNEATFHVPLRFTKLDLRDYLWNMYNVEVRAVRSYVQQSSLRRRNPFSNQFYRPMSKKYMTVDLKEPFQYPEIPENKEPWYNDLWKQREAAIKAQSDAQRHQAKGEILMKSAAARSSDRQELAALAKQVLSGQVKWSNDLVLDPKWDGFVKEQAAKKSAVRSEKRAERRAEEAEAAATEPAKEG